jgi:hypothetical protein
MEAHAARVKRLAIAVAKTAAPWTIIDVSPLLEALLDEEEEQTQLLKAIQRDVGLLKAAPWRTAQQYLQLAARPGQPEAQLQDYLRQARDALLTALPLHEDDAFSYGEVRYWLAWVLAMLGDATAAVTYAHDSWVRLVTDLEERAKTIRNLPSALTTGQSGGPRYLHKLRRFRDKQGGLRRMAIQDPEGSNVQAMMSINRLPDKEWLADEQIQTLLGLRNQAAASERSRDLAALLAPNRDIYPHAGIYMHLSSAGQLVFYQVRYTPAQLRPLKKPFDRFAADKNAIYHGVDLAREWSRSFTEQVADGIVLVEEKDRGWEQHPRKRGPVETGSVPASYLPKRYALASGFPDVRYRIYARGELRINGIRTVRP